jgi:8-amino-7-oxononanoate synthase
MTAAVLAGVEVATSEPGLRATLQANAAYFRSQLHSLGLSTGDSVSQVVPIIVGSNRQLLYELAHALRA